MVSIPSRLLVPVLSPLFAQYHLSFCSSLPTIAAPLIFIGIETIKPENGATTRFVENRFKKITHLVSAFQYLKYYCYGRNILCV